jgi:hypothetical protein
MPVRFLTAAQRDSYGQYTGPPAQDELSRFFHLSDDDRAQILNCRSDLSRLGFALQVTTVRYLGTFLDDPTDVPVLVRQTIARQLGIGNLTSPSRGSDFV